MTLCAAEHKPTAANVAEQYLQAAADHERAALGLAPLRRDEALVEAARAHAWQMVEHNTISHQFPHEIDLAARGSAAGARFSLISENVAQSPSALKIHTAWMNSEGHRHNLLDPQVDAVGIAVIARGGELFAVEDFEKTVKDLSLSQQEQAVAADVSRWGVSIESADASARKTCAGEEEAKAARGAGFIMRYTTSDLTRMPEQLRSRLQTGKYASAVVAACSKEEGEQFSMYRLAVLLYPRRN
jgi:hypothetical protein